MVRRQVGRLAFRGLKELENTRQAPLVRTVTTHVGSQKNAELQKSPERSQVQQKRRIGLPAQEEAYDEPSIDFSKQPLPINIDRVGAVSVVLEDEKNQPQGLFQNRDGFRFEDGRYAAFTKVGSCQIPILLGLIQQPFCLIWNFYAQLQHSNGNLCLLKWLQMPSMQRTACLVWNAGSVCSCYKFGVVDSVTALAFMSI